MYLFNATCSSNVRLEGKTAIVTGANCGIGKEVARDFYARGARVILACRNLEKTNEAVEDIKNNPPRRIKKDEYRNVAGELAIYHLDLCSLESVRACAKNLMTKEDTIHILVNNAGVAFTFQKKTEDGYDTTTQTNYLSPFLFTLLLLPKMQSSSPGCRIVNVSSILHRFGDIHFDDFFMEKSYGLLKCYSQSKLANILFTKELARRLKEANIHGINVYSLHPGLIPTNILRDSNRTVFPGTYFFYNLFTRVFCKNIEQGAQTIIYCSVDEKATNETGLYYKECSVVNPQWRARDEGYARKLWDLSCQLLHLQPAEDFNTFLKTI